MECIIIVRQKTSGVREVCVAFDQTNLDALAREESEYLCTLGMDIAQDGVLLPKNSKQPTVILGGDAPTLFIHLAEYARRHPDIAPNYPKWRRGVCVCLWPTKEDEGYGILGVYDGDDRCSVFLFPSREHGRRLLRMHGGGKDEAVMNEGTLPEGSTLDVVTLSPALSEWFVMSYQLYQVDTGNIV